jgi:hypothetical protein
MTSTLFEMIRNRFAFRLSSVVFPENIGPSVISKDIYYSCQASHLLIILIAKLFLEEISFQV